MRHLVYGPDHNEAVPHLAIIFYTATVLHLLDQHCGRIHCDATFSICPPFFYQLLVIHMEIQDHVLPAVYMLMTKKTKSLYIAAIGKLHEEIPGFSPSELMSDFEQALVQGFKGVFPQIRAIGCRFHHSQAIVRKVQKIGLAGPFNQDRAIARLVRSLMAMALLKEDLIRPTFEELRDIIRAFSDHLAVCVVAVRTTERQRAEARLVVFLVNVAAGEEFSNPNFMPLVTKREL